MMSSPRDPLPTELDAMADTLNAAWNGLVRGEIAPGDDGPYLQTLRRLHQADDAPALPRERQDRIWRELAAGAAPRPTLVVLGPFPPTSSNGHAAPPAVPPRQRWPLSALASAAVLALMLASVLLTVSLWQPNRWLRSAGAPGILADEIVFQQRLDAIPPGAALASVDRATLPPGAAWEQGTPATSGDGPMLYRIEAGDASLQADGPFQVTRRGAAPVDVAAGKTVDLTAGDVAFLPAGVASQWRNHGSAPASLIDAGLSDRAGNPDPAVQSVPLVREPAASVAAPADLTLRRLTLAPGATLPGAAD
ncbi:MAG TPA: hypothetical protein VFQ80_03280, partial [Thermomicrobiales bacterium]|nr:hypothetical protein [Thermomicrobiales bacterium]